MLLSMTGFGAAEASTQSHHVKVEIRTLNSKFFDINLRLSRELSDKELDIRNLLNQYIKRGKVNFSIELHSNDVVEPTVKINDALFKSYYSKFMSLAEEVNANTEGVFKLALQSPDVITSDEKAEIQYWEEIKAIIVKAMERCNEFRAQEGAALQAKMTEYIEAIREGLKAVTAQDDERILNIKQRMAGHLEEIKERVQVDQNRFEQEIIYYLEKIDITEEKVRLAGHLDYFLEVMKDPESQGKKLGFISQEIGREINTIGSKANDAIIQRAVVGMKDELEKIKEQSMNIL
jgi:uncharacterized protein (TIGR00255 family)